MGQSQSDESHALSHEEVVKALVGAEGCRLPHSLTRLPKWSLTPNIPGF